MWQISYRVPPEIPFVVYSRVIFRIASTLKSVGVSPGIAYVIFEGILSGGHPVFFLGVLPENILKFPSRTPAGISTRVPIYFFFRRSSADIHEI